MGKYGIQTQSWHSGRTKHVHGRLCKGEGINCEQWQTDHIPQALVDDSPTQKDSLARNTHDKSKLVISTQNKIADTY